MLFRSPTEIGNVNSIVLDEGMFIGAADSTREGTAIGLSAEDFISIDGLKSRVEQLQADDEIYEEHVARLLITHLTTVGHYKENEKMDKAIKHLEGFKQLLDQLKAADSISEHAHDTLLSGAEELLDMWQ